MKVLLIDPWGTGNTAEYLNGLIYGIGSHVELTVYTNVKFELENDIPCRIIRAFFRKSEIMKQGGVRKIVRGMEYVKSYIEILKILSDEKFDVVHINWLLFYRVDAIFLRLIKRKCAKIVYTAHNVFPHTNSHEYIQQLSKIYNTVDHIILHGNNIKEEFKEYFPSNLNKVFIQHHGANIKSKTNYSEETIDKELKEKVDKSQRIYICFGKIFYNKGIDRIISIWLKRSFRATLIIAGQVNEHFEKLDEILREAKQRENIIILDHYVDDNTLNYLIRKSNIIVLPYRHASMSGVIFTAADFSKTVLYTKVGALSEYLTSENSFECDNQDDMLEACIEHIEKNVSNIDLKDKGIKLQNSIQNTCSWENIGKSIVNEVYKREA